MYAGVDFLGRSPRLIYEAAPLALEKIVEKLTDGDATDLQRGGRERSTIRTISKTKLWRSTSLSDRYT